MAFEIVWTKRAADGYKKIVNYLAKEFGEKEVRNFLKDTDKFFLILSEHPEILQRTHKRPNLYRGPINKLTILTYRFDKKAKKIVLVNIRGARQRPLK